MPLPSETAKAVAKTPRTEPVYDIWGTVIGQITVCAGDTRTVINANKKAVLDAHTRKTLSVPSRLNGILREKLQELIATGYIVPCPWCEKPECKTDAGSYCYGYQRCLEQRIALGGANDCEEERASVVRFCDAYRKESSDVLRGPPEICSECPSEKAIPATLQNELGQRFCIYCYQSRASAGRLPREVRDNDVFVAMNVRPHPAELAAQGRASVRESREAVARVVATAAARELAKGHPASWPSNEGEY